MRVNDDRTSKWYTPVTNVPGNLFFNVDDDANMGGATSPQATETVATETVVNDGVQGDTQPPATESKDHHAFAEMRVKNKQMQEELSQYKQKQEWLDNWTKQNFADQGISSFDDYQSAWEKQVQEDINQKAAQGDPEAIKSLVQQEAKSLFDADKKRQQEEAINQKVKETLSQELKDLESEYGVSAKDTDELFSKSDINGEQIKKLMLAGFTASEAYKHANIDKFMSGELSKIKQETINQAAGYTHMKTNGTSPGSLKKIPQDVVNTYKKMFPGIKMEEIQKHFKG